MTQDAHSFIADLDEVDLVRFRVVGAYTRYDEAVRNALQDARQKILAGFESPGRKRENHLIWAAPGTGKTYFVQQVATALPPGIRYHELNLAKCTEPEFRSGLSGLEGNDACLCLIDEIDAKPQEPWPYEVLLPYLDAAVDRSARFVFVLAGSSGASLDEIKQGIAARPKGTDLLSRIPTGNEYVIGPMSLGDRMLIVLSQLRQAGREAGRDIRAIEKLGLYYVAQNPQLANARQLREFAVRAVERVPKSDDRVKYDHLFIPGDPENKAFWAQALPVAERLVNAFVILSGDSAPPTGAQLVKPGPRSRTHLPRHLTSFIGRDREITEVKQLLPTTGLLTLTGAGGCGKTRLALRVVADLVDQYPDGVWLAELATLSEPFLVPKAVASALDVPEQPGRSLTKTLIDFLRPKSLLLVLDNCEHLVGACAELTSILLRSCPTLRVLATSREALGIPGEVIWTVPSLSVPEAIRLSPPEHLAKYEAVRLFVERAANHQPKFAMTEGNALAIAQVCTRLDGIPLAIELAAARVKVLTVEQIAARLDDRFRLLTGGSRTALPRHQTLRAAMDWSYDLLSQRERAILRRLSVFAGGCTLEAAEAVCAGKRVNEREILDLLTQLVDKSLVNTETPSGEARYRMPETIRQYARDRLVASGEAAEVRTRHRTWYLALAERAEARLRGPEETMWLDRLEVEHDNLRAALGWSTTAVDDAETRVRLAAALYRFWDYHTHWGEARRWLETALAGGRDIKSTARVRALWAEGLLVWRQGDYGKAMALYEESLALARDLGDQKGIAQALMGRGLVTSWQGDLDAATALFEESLELSRNLEDKYWIAIVLSQMGVVARRKKDYAKAGALCEESLAMFQTLGTKRWIATSLRLTGHVVRLLGNLDRATMLYQESLVLFAETGDKWIATECIEGLALVASAQGHFERAARLFGADEAARETFGITMPRQERGDYERLGATTREGLGDAAFAAAWAEGRAMTLEQAIEYALAPESP